MVLLLVIPTICLMITFSAEIVKLVQKLMKPSSAPPELQKRLDDAKAELNKLREDVSHKRLQLDYSHSIWVMRAEQKVKDVQSKIMQYKLKRQFKGYVSNLVANYGLKTILSLTLCIISWRNLNNPVFIFGDCFNLQPLTGLLCFPTGVANGISVPMWALSCNVTFKFAYKYLKRKIKF